VAEAARLRGLEDAEYLEYIDLEIRRSREAAFSR
jgi:hypothetical protein